MTATDFIEKFTEIFEDSDPGDITLKTKFKELEEWSSLEALAIIAMVDEECGVNLTNTELRMASTVEDVWNLIQSKL